MKPRQLHQVVPDGDPVRHVLIVALDAPIPVEPPEADVLVLAPALNSWLRRWLSDEDAARRRAAERVAWFVDWLVRRGVQAEGRVGDADPLQAIADTLPIFPADMIVIATRPDPSNGIAGELASRVRARFALPVFLAEESAPIAAQRSIDGAPTDGTLVTIEDSLRRLPQFDPDLENEPSEIVRRFRAECAAAAGVLFSVPEYAFGIPGSFKNALDWTVGSGSFYRKPVTLLSVAPSGRGEHLRVALDLVLTAIDADVVHHSLPVAPGRP